MTEEAVEAVPEEVPAESPEIETPVEGEVPVDGEAPAEPVEGEVIPADGEATPEDLDAVVEMVKELKLKVDGKDVIESLPFEVSPEQAEYLTKQLQLAKMSQSRAQEAADLRKKDSQRSVELEEFLNTLKSDPSSILNQLGIDVNEFAEGVMNQEVERMQLTPEEREIAELKEKLQKIQEDEAKNKKANEDRESEALKNQYAAEYEKNLMEAIDEHGLPNSPFIIGKMVNLVSTALENGLDLDFKDVAGMVKDEHQADLNSRISGLSADELINMLSDEIRKDVVSKSIPKKEEKKAAPPTADHVTESGKVAPKEEKKKYRSGRSEDFFRNL